MILGKQDSSSIRLNTLISDIQSKNELHKLLFIVPTHRNKRDLRLRFIRQGIREGDRKFQIETLDNFCVQLMRKSGSQFRLLDDASGFVFLRQALKKIKPDYLRPYKDNIPDGIQKILYSVFSSWRRENMSLLNLLNSAELLPEYEKKRLTDIVQVFESFISTVNSAGYITAGDLFLLAVNSEANIQSYFRSIYPDVETIIIRGYSEFANLDVEFVDRLSLMEQVTLFIELDYYENNSEAFGAIKECYEKFLRRGFLKIEDIEEDRDDLFIMEAKSRLFLQQRKQNEDTRFVDKLSVISSSNPADEVCTIAKEIKRICIDAKVAPSKICVIVNSIHEYSQIVKNTFFEYGIPLNLTDRPYLSSLLPVIDIMSFLEILQEDFSYDSIMRTFSGELIPLYKCSLNDIRQVAVKYRIVRGEKLWLNVEQFARAIGTDEDDADRLEKDLKRAGRVADAIAELSNKLKVFHRETSPHAFFAELKILVGGFNFLAKVNTVPVAQSGTLLKSVADFLTSVESVIELIILEYGSDEKHSFQFYLRNIRQALSFTRFTEPDPQRFGVTVTTPNEVWGLKFDYVFVAGLYDGNFPTTIKTEFFSTENAQDTEKRHLLAQQNIFFQTLRTWKKHIYFSRPLMLDGKEVMQSRFLTSIKNAFRTSEFQTDILTDKMYSKPELLSALGKNKENGALASETNTDLKQLIEDALASVEIAAEVKNGSEVADSYRGILDTAALSPDAIAKLMKLQDKVFSISQFEKYAGCPYKYFAERLLNLPEMQDPNDEIDRKDIGSMLHLILFKFMSKMKLESIVIRQCSDAVFDKAFSVLSEVAKETLEKEYAGAKLSFWDTESLFGVGGNINNSLLYLFLTNEREGTFYTPESFEYSFGKGQEEETGTDFDVHGIKLRGKIDRIDVDTDKKVFTVVDYKTGATAKYKDIENGFSLQLPIYLEAAKQKLDAEYGGDFNPLYPIYYTIKPKKKELRRIPIGAGSKLNESFEALSQDELENISESTREMIALTSQHIQNYHQEMLSGKFPVEPQPDACKYCTYQSTCRINEMKME